MSFGPPNLGSMDRLHPKLEPVRPVWVNLTALYPPAPDGARTRVVDGLDLAGEVPGFVHGWLRGGSGLWVARCNYDLRYVDGRAQMERAQDQLVPATALRQREVGGVAGRSR
jgi:hypothetical protein